MKSRVALGLCLVLLGLLGGWWYCQKEKPEDNITAIAARSSMTDFVPLRLYFIHSFDASYCTVELSGDGTVHFYSSSNPKNFYGDDPMITEKVIVPTSEDWKAFFEVCEKADLWNLKEDNRSIPGEYLFNPLDYYKWSLNLEYPGKTLTLEGKEVFLEPEAKEALGIEIVNDNIYSGDEFGLLVGKIRIHSPDIELYSSYYPLFLDGYGLTSEKLHIASKYLEIQSILDALAKYILKSDYTFQTLRYDTN